MRDAIFVVLLAASMILMTPAPSLAQEALADQAPTDDAAENESATRPSSCVACHGSTDWFDDEHVDMTLAFAGRAAAERPSEDVHAALGFSCHDCHGGNPDPDLADDLDAAMDPEWAENPYLEDLSAAAVPALCARCHSDPEFMRRFDPSARVDQLAEYQTSHHGRLLAQGRDDVATCSACHGYHEVLAVADPASRVHPTHVAETCGSCHSDGERMAEATLDDGRPLPTNQQALWSGSVHAAALLERGDLSAPTCNDCHGNHGAAPPGVASISFVCGQCHGREARLFREGPKPAAYEEHNLLMEGLGPGACGDCHEEPEPAATLAESSIPWLSQIDHLSECASCHGHHAVRRPTLAMLTPLPETPCAFCHEGPGLEADDASRRDLYESWREIVLAEAAAVGHDEASDARFDFLVDRAQELPVHTEGGEEGAAVLRPEFRRLFEKYRMGKTTETWTSADGTEHSVEVVQCGDCHAEEPLLADEGVGRATAAAFAGSLHEVAAATAQAERLLLRARRGGVATRDGLAEIDQAVDAMISMEVLVHRFEPSGEFAAAHDEAMASAKAALAAGHAGLDELSFRRRGLLVMLLFVALVAVGLWLKIREMESREIESRAMEPRAMD